MMNHYHVSMRRRSVPLHKRRRAQVLRLEQMDLSVRCEMTVTGVLHLVTLRRLRGLNFGSDESQLSSSLKTTCILDISLHLMRPLVLLQRLDLSMSAAITDSALVAINNFLQLRHLNLKGCRNIADKGLRHLTELKLLKFLSINSCNNITDVGLARIVSLPSLLWLDIGETPGILGIGTCDAEPEACLRRYSIRDPLLLRSLNAGLAAISSLTQLNQLDCTVA